MSNDDDSPITAILRAVPRVDVEALLLSYDTEFDIPLRHWQALGLLSLTRSIGGSGGGISPVTARVGEAWCDIIRADVELDLRRGLSVIESSRAEAATLLERAAGGSIDAYVAARWHDGAGKLLYRVGSHARARMNFTTACSAAKRHELWWCQPDLHSNLLRASGEEARQASAAADVSAPLEAAVADCEAVAAGQGIVLTAGRPDSRAGRELLRGYSSLLHNLAWSVRGADPIRSMELSRRASDISTRLGDAYRLAQAVNHQALLIQDQHAALGVPRSDAEPLYETVKTLGWVRGARIAEQNLAIMRGGRAGAKALARLLELLIAETESTGGPAGLDTDVRQYTVQAYVRLAEELARGRATRANVKLRDHARAHELDLARSVHQVIALPAYKRAYNRTVRPVFLRRIARDLAAVRRVPKQHWEDVLTMVEESSGRELLDLLTSAALPQLGPPPEPAAAPARRASTRTRSKPTTSGPKARRTGLRRTAPADIDRDREALMAREREFEEQFLQQPLEAAPPDREIARIAERYVVNHPGTCIVRYFSHCESGTDPTGLSAFVIRDGVTRPIFCAEIEKVRTLSVDLRAGRLPTEGHSRRMWSLLLQPIWEAVTADRDPINHLVVIPTDELFGMPVHIASPVGYDSEPLGALVPLSQSVSLTAFLTRGRHLLRRQRVEPNDDLAAFVVRDSGITAGELVRARWPARHTVVAGSVPDGLSPRVRRCAADWDGLRTLAEARPEFFLYAGHGQYHPSYGELGPYLDMRDAAGNRDRLTPYDIALRVRLPRNRLTILAACLAGQGVQTAGGDTAGFLRAFIAAGAGAIAMPLWEVLDRAIAETAGTLLAESRRAAAAGEPYDVVATLHQHYRDTVADRHAWIDYLPLALYT